MTNKFWPLLTVEDQNSNICENTAVSDNSLEVKNGCRNTVLDSKIVTENTNPQQKLGCLNLNLNSIGVDNASQ